MCRSVSSTIVNPCVCFLVDGAPLNFLPRLATFLLPDGGLDGDDDDAIDGGCCTEEDDGGGDEDDDVSSIFIEIDILRAS